MSGRPTPVFLTNCSGTLGHFDESSCCNCFLPHDQHEIHEGERFFCQDYDSSVNIASPKYWHLITPDSAVRLHLCYVVRAAGPGTLEFFEAPTTSGNGTQLTISNSNRNSAATCDMLMYFDPTVTLDGTRLDVNVIGTDGTGAIGGEGGISERSNKRILKQNTKYLIKFTPISDGTRVSCCVEVGQK